MLTFTTTTTLTKGVRPTTTTCMIEKSKVKVKSNYFIVRPKVDQRAGLLSLPHLGNFRRTAFTTSAFTS